MASAPRASSDVGASLLERRFSFYAAYHQNPVNQAIHIVCVPLIFWSSLVVAGVLLPGRVTNPLVAAAGGSSSDALAPDVPTAVTLAYLAYYLVLSPKLAVRAVSDTNKCHAHGCGVVVVATALVASHQHYVACRGCTACAGTEHRSLAVLTVYHTRAVCMCACVCVAGDVERTACRVAGTGKGLHRFHGCDLRPSARCWGPCAGVGTAVLRPRQARRCDCGGLLS